MLSLKLTKLVPNPSLNFPVLSPNYEVHSTLPAENASNSTPVFCTQVDVLTNQLIDYAMPRSYPLICRKLPSVPLLRIALGHFEQAYLDIAEKVSADIVKLFKIEVATSLGSITDLVTLSWLSSHWPSLYSA
jgi:hypothetical protein